MASLSDLNLEKLSIEELGQLLIDAKKAYYTTGKPIMDDHTYDILEDVLRQKNPHHRFFTKVGNPNFDTGWEKHPHIMPMGSQNKVTKYDDLVGYFELKKIPQNTEFVVQPKCDGISLEIIYQNGNLVEAITRGDGLVGDVITQNVVKMKNFVEHPVPSKAQGFSGSVRCEIVVTKKDFEKLPSEYSNPRNAASGISQRLDSKYSEYCSLYTVDLYPYPSSENDKMDLLKKLGFTPVESHLVTKTENIETIYQQFLTEKRNSYPYDIDGLVIKINDIKLSQSLGSKNNRPKSQVAYKFPAESNTTQIKNIVWQVGPMGTITPVAQVEPIELSGAVVTYASLANYDLIREKNINLGDIVEVSRRGDVIPHVESVVTKVNSKVISKPEVCPSCGTKLISEDKFLKCPNVKGCKSQILGSLRLFCSTLDILGLSDKTITKLYQAGRIRLPGDFFKLNVSDIEDLDNLGEKSAKNIINQIQAKKTLTLKQVFDAAVIPNFSGQRIQQLITAGFDTPEKLLNISQSELVKLPGFQSTLADKVWQGISSRKSWIESILSEVKIKNLKLKIKNLEGLSFCITGPLSQPRKDIVDQIEAHGGKVTSSVTKNTSYLICNQASNSDKYLSALKLHVTIINESDFQKLL